MSEILSPLTPEELLKNGVCCGSGCENCVYTPRHQKGNQRVDWKWVVFYEEHRGHLSYQDYLDGIKREGVGKKSN